MNRKNNSQLLKICFAAMFAALICVATMIIRIPSPLGGYINFGDTFIILAGWMMGPVYGFAAGGIGSAFADLFAGYAAYVPGTFIIKGFMATAAWIIYDGFSKRGRFCFKIRRFTAASCAEAIMIIGYYFYAAVPMGEGGAAVLTIIPNIVQGFMGFIGSLIISAILERTGIFSKFSSLFK